MKKSFLVIVLGMAIGYVFGARAGRERYDELVERANGIWKNPHASKPREDAVVPAAGAKATAAKPATRTPATRKPATPKPPTTPTT